MKKYKIIVEEVIEKEDKNYPKTETVYEQVIMIVDNTSKVLENIIKAVNQI